MGGLSPPRLAAAVANAGGLGMLSVYGASPHVITEQISLAQQLTDGPMGANFIMRAVEPHDAQACVAAAATKAQVVEFFYSEPDPVLIDSYAERNRCVVPRPTPPSMTTKSARRRRSVHVHEPATSMSNSAHASRRVGR
jgi:NAD(P)H-dependent flavin oxidoreductase YrpB (nitropropane dioxygenase family)